jgi:hypothetical protein
MLYFSPPTSSSILHDAMFRGEIGFIQTPDQGNRLLDDVTWCMDNGCFSQTRAEKGAPWDEEGWWKCLIKHAPQAYRCKFATAPDIVNWIDGEPHGDAEATLIKAMPWFSRIRELGYPAGFVCQDGLNPDDVPWGDIDAIFIGGSDDYKIGHKRLTMGGLPKGHVPCEGVIRRAQARGKWVHLGRVNSRMRFRFAKKYLKVHSVDGTYITFGPDKNLPYLLSWVREKEVRREQDQLRFF